MGWWKRCLRAKGWVAALFVLAGLTFGTTARAEGYGACVWSKAPELHQDFLTAYHQGVSAGLAFLSTNGPKLTPQMQACSPGDQAAKTWLIRAVTAQAMQDGAVQELAALIQLDRAKLDTAWREAPKEVTDCFRASADALFGISAPACPEPTRIRILDQIGVPATPRTPQVVHALNFFLAAAEMERADALIDESKNAAAVARPAVSGSLPLYSGPTTMTLKVQPVPADQHRDVPFDKEGWLFFQARFGDRDAWAFLDSGAQTSLLDAGLARDLDLQVFDLFRATARGLGGSQTALRVVKDVTVLIPGQAQMQFSIMPAIDRITTGPQQGRRVEFVLGRDVLSKLAVVIDPTKRVFRFGVSGSYRAPTGASVLDITPTSVATVTINGEQLRLQIDTGFNGDMTLTPDAWRRLNLTQTGTSQGVGIDGVARTSRLGHLSEITLGSVVVRDVNVSEISTPSADWDGQIGLGVLTRFQVAMDLGAGKLWLTLGPAAPSPPNAPRPPVASPPPNPRPPVVLNPSVARPPSPGLNLGSCVWTKAPPSLRAAFVAAYQADPKQQGSDAVIAHDAEFQALAKECVPSLAAPPAWVQQAIKWQAVADIAAGELLALSKLDRAKLNDAWAHAGPPALICLKSNAQGGVIADAGSAPACAAAAVGPLLDSLVIPKTPTDPAAAQAIIFFNAVAKGEVFEALIYRQGAAAPIPVPLRPPASAPPPPSAPAAASAPG